MTTKIAAYDLRTRFQPLEPLNVGQHIGLKAYLRDATKAIMKVTNKTGEIHLSIKDRPDYFDSKQVQVHTKTHCVSPVLLVSLGIPNEDIITEFRKLRAPINHKE